LDIPCTLIFYGKEKVTQEIKDIEEVARNWWTLVVGLWHLKNYGNLHFHMLNLLVAMLLLFANHMLCHQ